MSHSADPAVAAFLAPATNLSDSEKYQISRLFHRLSDKSVFVGWLMTVFPHLGKFFSSPACNLQFRLSYNTPDGVYEHRAPAGHTKYPAHLINVCFEECLSSADPSGASSETSNHLLSFFAALDTGLRETTHQGLLAQNFLLPYDNFVRDETECPGVAAQLDSIYRGAAVKQIHKALLARNLIVHATFQALHGSDQTETYSVQPNVAKLAAAGVPIAYRYHSPPKALRSRYYPGDPYLKDFRFPSKIEHDPETIKMILSPKHVVLLIRPSGAYFSDFGIQGTIIDLGLEAPYISERLGEIQIPPDFLAARTAGAAGPAAGQSSFA